MIAVAPAGVFVIDARHHKGLVRTKRPGSLDQLGAPELHVGRRNCTPTLEALSHQVTVVRATLDPSPWGCRGAGDTPCSASPGPSGDSPRRPWSGTSGWDGPASWPGRCARRGSWTPPPCRRWPAPRRPAAGGVTGGPPPGRRPACGFPASGDGAGPTRRTDPARHRARAPSTIRWPDRTHSVEPPTHGRLHHHPRPRPGVGRRPVRRARGGGLRRRLHLRDPARPVPAPGPGRRPDGHPAAGHGGGHRLRPHPDAARHTWPTTSRTCRPGGSCWASAPRSGPHIERRYSMPWSRPADRLREMVLAIRAIWDAWDGVAPLDFRGEFYTHTLMPPAFDPGPARFGRPPILLGGVGPRMTPWPPRWGTASWSIRSRPPRRSGAAHAVRPSIEGLARSGRARGRPRGGRWSPSIATGDDGAELTGPSRWCGASSPSTDRPRPTPPSSSATVGSRCTPVSTSCPRRAAGTTWPALIPDEVLESIAVVGRRDDIAGLIRAKVAGVADAVSLECTRRPDPGHFADICTALKSGG